jgi:hypothetical protein
MVLCPAELTKIALMTGSASKTACSRKSGMVSRMICFVDSSPWISSNFRTSRNFPNAVHSIANQDEKQLFSDN